MPIVRTSPVHPPEERPPWEMLRPMPASRISQRHPILVGHRGMKGSAPENTLAAFRAAAQAGIDGVEFDVQRTKDGCLIVYHDENVERLTGQKGQIEDLTWDEIKDLDVGSDFSEEFCGEHIPTLRQAFDYLRQTDLLLFIELKEPWRYPGIEEALVALIREYDLVPRVQVRSFYHDSLYEVYHLAPEISLSGLWLYGLPEDNEVTFKTVNAFYPLLTPEKIAHIHERGQQVTAWVVDDLDAARALIAAGVNGITSDYPEQLIALVNGEAR